MTQHLNPRAPWVISTHELGRRPGLMRKMTLTLPAPADIGVEMIGVPKDAEVELEIRLEAVMDGVLVTGTARSKLSGECSRCLDPMSSDIEVNLQELFFYSSEDSSEDDSLLEGDLLDLEPVFRDAVVLALPFIPVCREDCTGLCVECGTKLADAGEDHQHEKIDARWASLQGLVSKNTNDQES